MSELNEAIVKELEQADFDSVIEKHGIVILYGMLEPRDSDICLPGISDFLEFCVVNGIKSVIVCSASNDDEVNLEIDYEVCKKEISDSFNDNLKRPLFSYFPEHIEQDFYAPVLEDVLQQMKHEITEINAAQAADRSVDSDDDPSHFRMVYALYGGNRVFTFPYLTDYYAAEKVSDNEAIITQAALIKKYKRLMDAKLWDRQREAREESRRITEEITTKLKKEVFEQITAAIRENQNLTFMNLQMQRNDYADKLYYEWRENRGNNYPWLTKTAVRDLVQKEYYNLGNNHSPFV